LQTYREEVDPGLHGAAEWLLRRWNQDEPLRQANEELTRNNEMREERLERIKRSFTREKEKAEPQWYVNGQGQTMVVIPKPVGAFAMGSPPTEKGRLAAVEKNGFDSEFQHSEGIGRSFAVAAKPVTASEYRSFDNSFKVDLRYAREADCPVVGVSWYDAAAYCNWLSEKEGLKEQSCYETVEGRLQLKDNYLHLTGYRLPTEAEWEFACRAGAKTARFYGESEELLEDYGWFSSRSKPVGGKRPNDLGLFDMHGNVWNWCLDAFIPVPRDGREPITWDKEDVINPRSNLRVMRGGSFLNLPLTARSAYRDRTPASAVYHSYGFRVARTFAAN
jgi:eukaryotic-like serine/threonine-protein kinase